MKRFLDKELVKISFTHSPKDGHLANHNGLLLSQVIQIIEVIASTKACLEPSAPESSPKMQELAGPTCKGSLEVGELMPS
ncbi:uncharacterized protein [Macaca nemestrina]|uniref:uncharacterized protein n=1 Tax=Macaca nemestrina TaxID=9545 RepID=UPI0005F4498D|nr:uncharacterized protein LOC105477994 [Macaca nemestrina]XP_011733238.1 uncharacterized protein LOC105477994 [Macaca nemestrina]XP_024647349.1 uncharacterized protein LOC105477994 [Macaca nemestrina]